jgi:hypothetical protein
LKPGENRFPPPESTNFEHPTTYIIFNFTLRLPAFTFKRFATLYYSFISMSMNVFIGSSPAAILANG